MLGMFPKKSQTCLFFFKVGNDKPAGFFKILIDNIDIEPNLSNGP